MANAIVNMSALFLLFVAGLMFMRVIMHVIKLDEKPRAIIEAALFLFAVVAVSLRIFGEW